MKCKILWIALIAFAGMPVVALSDDISGEWRAEMTGQDPRITRAIYEFKVDGNKLTGAVFGYMEDERPILEGKVSGDDIFFILKEYVGNRVFEYRYFGKVSVDTIKFKVYLLGSGNRSWKFTAKKVSR